MNIPAQFRICALAACGTVYMMFWSSLSQDGIKGTKIVARNPDETHHMDGMAPRQYAKPKNPHFNADDSGASNYPTLRPEAALRYPKESDFALASAKILLDNGQIKDAMLALTQLRHDSTRKRAIRELLIYFLARSPSDQDVKIWFQGFENDGPLAADDDQVAGDHSELGRYLYNQSPKFLVGLLADVNSTWSQELAVGALVEQSEANPALIDHLSELPETKRRAVLFQVANNSQHLKLNEFTELVKDWGGDDNQRNHYIEAWLEGKAGMPSGELFSQANECPIVWVRAEMEVLAYKRWLQEEPYIATAAIRRDAKHLSSTSYDKILMNIVAIAQVDGDQAAARAWAETSRTEQAREYFRKMFVLPNPNKRDTDNGGR